MRHNDRLYGALCTFDRQDRDHAYDRACDYIYQHVEVIVTVSEQRYTLWANLRHLSSPETVTPTETQALPAA